MNKTSCKPAGLDDTGRIHKMLFKREFTLSKPVSDAILNIGSSGLYSLKVNGQRLGDGPCRSYPEFAEYDSYDLTEYLVTGKNEIFVEVLHQNTSSFHRLKSEASFYADGTIGKINLETPGEWLAAIDKTEIDDSPLFSFAIGPVQFRDERKGISPWLPAVMAEAAAPTVLRSLPQLTEREVVPKKIEINSVKNSYTLYSYTMVDTTIDCTGNESSQTPISTISSWFYSSQKQNVECECWWGEYFVNMKKIPVRKAEDRQFITLPLNKGWNFFQTASGYCHGKWEFALNLPDSAGLIVNALNEQEHKGTFNLFLYDGAEPEIKRLSRPVKSPFMNLCWAKINDKVEDIPAGKSRLIKVDMGKIVLGRIFIELDTTEGTVVDIAYSEQLKNNRVDYRKNVLVHAAEHWVTKAGRSHLETFQRRGFRYLEILIQDHLVPVDIIKIGVMENVYPYKHIGSFQCSDDGFNSLWKYGERTLELCSEDIISDCPWRERTLYGGDMLAGMGTSLSVDRDLRLIKRSIDVFMQSFNPKTKWLQSMVPVDRERIPLYEYPMLTVICMEWYYRLTGDKKFINKWKNVLNVMLEQFLALKTEQGLYDPPHPPFIMHHYPLADKFSLAFHACGVKFLRACASILKKREATVRANELELTIIKHFYNTETGAFYDAIYKIEPVNCAGNAWNVYFTDCFKGHEAGIIKLLTDKLSNFSTNNEIGSVSSYNMFYLLGALYKLGAEVEAENAIRKVYAEMLENPTGTIWEHSNREKSLCHVWSTAPNYYFSTCVLGVKQDRADKIIIAPQADSLSWAKGIVPHMAGDVQVSWKIEDKMLKLFYSAPEGCEVEVCPRGKLSKLHLEVTTDKHSCV